MKKSIVIVGKKSFVASSLYKYLNSKFKVRNIDFKSLIKKKEKFFKRNDLIINCSSNKNYIFKKYNSKYDFDYQIVKKIEKFKTKFIFLSTRKVYKLKSNIKENDKILPKCNYSINKYITEKKITKILDKKVLILRISNLIGITNKTSDRKLHKTFLDMFILNAKKGIIFNNQGIYKDFVPLGLLCKSIYLLIKANANGVYNISLGKKVYLNDLTNWLNYYNKTSWKKINFIANKTTNENQDNFYLNNTKLRRKIDIKIKLIDLKKECKKVSKKIFL